MGQTSSGLTVIANTIQQVEGYYPGTPAYTNNNPGNLMYLPSSSIQTSNGAIQGTPMGSTGSYFAAFPSYQAGYNALLTQIQAYGTQGLTIEQMMEKYAPPKDNNGNPTGNNPTVYANQIAAALGVTTDTSVADAINGTGSVGVDLTGDNSGDDGSTTTIDPTTLTIAGLVIIASLALS